MKKQEYIKHIEDTYKSKGIEERYEQFKKNVIFSNGMTIKDFIFVMEKYYVLREAQSWTEFNHYVDFLKLEEDI